MVSTLQVRMRLSWVFHNITGRFKFSRVFCLRASLIIYGSFTITDSYCISPSKASVHTPRTRTSIAQEPKLMHHPGLLKSQWPTVLLAPKIRSLSFICIKSFRIWAILWSPEMSLYEFMKIEVFTYPNLSSPCISVPGIRVHPSCKSQLTQWLTVPIEAFPMAGCPNGKLSQWQTIPMANCPNGKLSQWQAVPMEKCPNGKLSLIWQPQRLDNPKD
jgi:hypothetical protein